jgi:hypothetical protein
MVAISVFLVLNYVRELWIYFMRRDQFDVLSKPKIAYGEDGTKQVGRNDRLFFSYPFLILGFGGFGWVLASSS